MISPSLLLVTLVTTNYIEVERTDGYLSTKAYYNNDLFTMNIIIDPNIETNIGFDINKNITITTDISSYIVSGNNRILSIWDTQIDNLLLCDNRIYDRFINDACIGSPTYNLFFKCNNVCNTTSEIIILESKSSINKIIVNLEIDFYSQFHKSNIINCDVIFISKIKLLCSDIITINNSQPTIILSFQKLKPNIEINTLNKTLTIRQNNDQNIYEMINNVILVLIFPSLLILLKRKELEHIEKSSIITIALTAIVSLSASDITKGLPEANNFLLILIVYIYYILPKTKVDHKTIIPVAYVLLHGLTLSLNDNFGNMNKFLISFTIGIAIILKISYFIKQYNDLIVYYFLSIVAITVTILLLIKPSIQDSEVFSSIESYFASFSFSLTLITTYLYSS